MNHYGAVLFDHDGDGGVNAPTPTAWERHSGPSPRLRLTVPIYDADGNYLFNREFMIHPYEYGVAQSLNTGTLEFWVPSISFKGPHHGVPIDIWFDDDYDLGGGHAEPRADLAFREAIVAYMRDDTAPHPDGIGEKYFRITSETFIGTSHGDIQIAFRNERDGLSVMVGAKGEEVEVARITGDGKVLASGGLGVGNVEHAQWKPGNVTGKTEAFDRHGNHIGYFAIYDDVY